MKFIIRDTDILQRVYAAIAQIPINSEKVIEVIIQPHQTKRSLESNAYYHVVIRDIAKHLGYTPAEVKTITKYALGYFHEIKGKEATLMVFDETSKMSVEDMGVIITQTCDWGISKGVVFSQAEYNVEFRV